MCLSLPLRAGLLLTGTSRSFSFDRLNVSEFDWDNLRSTRMEFATPFFSARFSEAVHRSRGDVSVAVIREGNEVIGIFPFHRFRGSAVPVGRFLNDSHNVIADRLDP